MIWGHGSIKPIPIRKLIGENQWDAKSNPSVCLAFGTKILLFMAMRLLIQSKAGKPYNISATIAACGPVA
jgi:hypothetical protein